jgi:hypothetical protein
MEFAALLESNLSSLEVTIPDRQLAELDKLTEPPGPARSWERKWEHVLLREL